MLPVSNLPLIRIGGVPIAGQLTASTDVRHMMTSLRCRQARGFLPVVFARDICLWYLRALGATDESACQRPSQLH
jgi:hypothetical protein